MIPIKDDNPTRKKPIIRLLILCICTTVFLIQTTSSLNNEYIFFFGFKPASLFNPDFNMPTFYPILTIFTLSKIVEIATRSVVIISEASSF